MGTQRKLPTRKHDTVLFCQLESVMQYTQTHLTNEMCGLDVLYLTKLTTKYKVVQI